MMEWVLELILYSSARRVEQWLMQYVPSSIPDYVDNRDGKPILHIGSPIIIDKEESKFVKILGSPYLKGDSQGLRFYYLDVSVGPLNTIEEEDETKVSIPLLRIFEKTNEKTIVKINLQQVAIYLYIKDMTQEIARLWPETKRDISNLDAGINWLDMDDILFDFVIETEPQNFMEWIHIELGEKYPGAFTYELNNIEYLTHISGDYLPPSSLTSIWEYVIFAHDTVFGKDENTGKVEAYEGLSGAIARIEMRHIINNRYHVKCLCGSFYPQISEWLNALGDKVARVYQPIESLKSGTQLGETGSQPELEGYLDEWGKSADASVEDEQGDLIKLTKLQKGIIDAYQELIKDKAAITIDSIIARLSTNGVLNRAGEPYSREWVTKQRKKLENIGYEIPL